MDGKSLEPHVGSRRLLNEQGVELGDLDATLKSLEVQGKTAMLVAIDKQAAGVVAVADTIKEDSKSAIKAMHDGLAGAFEQKLTVSPSRTHLKP